MSRLFATAIIFLFVTPVLFVYAAEIRIIPERVIQGDPFMIVVDGVGGTSSVDQIFFDKETLWPMLYRGEVIALAPVDLRKSPGQYEIIVIFKDGTKLSRIILVGARTKTERPLGIPEKLGGNTEESQYKLLSSLAEESYFISNTKTANEPLWTNDFHYPLKEILATDPYGYLRKTGYYNIAHKGVDFSAREGTRVYSIGDGVVRLIRDFRVYGKTVVIDHGLGLSSVYLHLSDIRVREGQKVGRGERIALSGSTGYAERPHLHLSLKINGISIDPINFFNLFID